MKGHSNLGPSVAEKWLNCAGSIQMEKNLPPVPDSKYANEGSAAHELAESCLIHGYPTSEFLNTRLPESQIIVSQEMCEYIQEYVDFVRAIPGDHEYEQKVSYEEWASGGFGTADDIAVTDDTIYVTDLKYGKGIPVDAYENPQGKLYALGALSERSSFQYFEKVVITIHQPRLNSVTQFETTPSDIYQWANDIVRPAALRCLEPNAPLNPGTKQCRWCRAKPICPALLRSTEETLLMEFDDMRDPVPVALLTDEQIKIVLENKPLIIDWLNSIETHVMKRICGGNNFPGYKIVHGRSNRKWSDDLAAEEVLVSLLGDKAYTKKLITAPQAEKAVGKDNLDYIKPLIVKPDGAPTLVPDTDKRKEVVTITAEDF
jgi:hypothetical protein